MTVASHPAITHFSRAIADRPAKVGRPTLSEPGVNRTDKLDTIFNVIGHTQLKLKIESGDDNERRQSAERRRTAIPGVLRELLSGSINHRPIFVTGHVSDCEHGRIREVSAHYWERLTVAAMTARYAVQAGFKPA